MKKKILITSLLSIAVCFSLIIGATLALFTSKSNVNIAVSSGKVSVVASVDTESIQTKQLNTDYVNGVEGMFGGSESLDMSEAGTVSLENILPGDGVRFDIVVTNDSTVNVQYQTVITVEGDIDLFIGLKVTVGDKVFDGMSAYSTWQHLTTEQKEVSKTTVSIELPEDAGNQYQGKTCSIVYRVNAVQGNAEVEEVPGGENIIPVYTENDLRLFANSVNIGNSFSGKTVLLMDDIDLKMESWTPIGNLSNAFNGTFDGNGKTISNVYVDTPLVDAVGLFGHAVGATLKNLVISGAEITGRDKVGALVGDLYTGSAENVTVDNANLNGGHYVGGITGYTYGEIKNSTVKNLTAKAVPYLVGDSYDNGDKVGGLVGWAYSCELIENSVTDVSLTAYRDVGGIAGCVGKDGSDPVVTNNTVNNAKIFVDQGTNAYGDKDMNAGLVVGRQANFTLDLDSNTVSGENTIEQVIAEGFHIDLLSENKEYLIYNIAGFKNFREYVNSGTTFLKRTVLLMDDIDLENEEWTPIGNASNPFSGTFDGNGKTISNLYINKKQNQNIGLFGHTTNGEVKNFTLHNADVTGWLNVGAIAGSPYTSKMTGLQLTGLVKVTGYSYVGGMFGKNAYQNLSDLTIAVSDGSLVKADSEGYRTYVGGVVGFMGEGNITVSNVTSNIDVIGSTCDVGGITGIAHYGNTFINCSSSGKVSLIGCRFEENKMEIGGIAGVWMNSASGKVTLKNCSFTGTLYATMSDGSDYSSELTENTLTGAKYTPSSDAGELIIE